MKKEITRTEGAGMPEGRVRDLFRQICSAMMYLHSNNIVHRDLKPQNIMVTADHKTVKIIDFGFTNVFDEGDVLASFIGSPSYAAPEILQGIKYAGNKVDVWSLGVILYHMAVGVHPFTAKTMEQLYDRVISGRYTRIPNTVAPGPSQKQKRERESARAHARKKKKSRKLSCPYFSSHRHFVSFSSLSPSRLFFFQ